MHIRPEDTSIDVVGDVEQMVVIVPVDPDVDEAEDVREEERENREECREIIAMRDTKLEHHDGDENGNHAVAEGLEAGGFHG